ncbi:hypothetical protein ACIBI9_65755 [Nonomuraea sp. NPDC050451]|uniref:hypothetical protein n=1 Tax=Nonomuraea sp. NPDC050451 TaxID=3364364 RepID=UPI00379FD9E5
MLQVFGSADAPTAVQGIVRRKESTAPFALWTNWTVLGFGPPNVHHVAADVLQDGRLHAFGVCNTGGGELHVMATWKQTSAVDSGWVTPVEMTTGTLSRPRVLAVLRLSDGRLQIVGANGQRLITTWKATSDPSAAWTPWQEFPSPEPVRTARVLCTSSIADGRPVVFATNKDGEFQSCHKQTTNPNAAWSPWGPWSGPGLLAVTAAQLTDGRIQVFGVSKDNKLWTSWGAGDPPNGSWAPWSTHPIP